MTKTERNNITKWLLITLAVNALLFVVSHFTHSWAAHTEDWSEQGWYAMIWATGITKVSLSIGLLIILIE